MASIPPVEQIQEGDNRSTRRLIPKVGLTYANGHPPGDDIKGANSVVRACVFRDLLWWKLLPCSTYDVAQLCRQSFTDRFSQHKQMFPMSRE